MVRFRGRKRKGEMMSLYYNSKKQLLQVSTVKGGIYICCLLCKSKSALRHHRATMNQVRVAWQGMGGQQERGMDNTERRNNNWGKNWGVQLFLSLENKTSTREGALRWRVQSSLGLRRQSCAEVCRLLQENGQEIGYKFAVSGAEHPSRRCNRIPESMGCLMCPAVP